MTTLLTETHIHTNIGSSCGKVSPAEIPWLYKNAGYDAIVITDHYAEETITTYPKSADAWLEGYRMARDAGKEAGIKVFLGMELRVKSLGIEDFLVYGLDEAFIKKMTSSIFCRCPMPSRFWIHAVFWFIRRIRSGMKMSFRTLGLCTESRYTTENCGKKIITKKRNHTRKNIHSCRLRAAISIDMRMSAPAEFILIRESKQNRSSPRI
jgi:hypothetical protein